MKKSSIQLVAISALIASFVTGVFFTSNGKSVESMDIAETSYPDLSTLYAKLDSQQQELDSLYRKLELVENGLLKATNDRKSMQEALLGKIENIQIQPVDINAFAALTPVVANVAAAPQTFDERIDQLRSEEFDQVNTTATAKALDDFLYQFDSHQSTLQELNCYQSGCIALVSHPNNNVSENFVENILTSSDEIVANGFSVDTQPGPNGQQITRLYVKTQ